MSILVIEDRIADRLHPVTTARLCGAVTSGALRLFDILTSLSVPLYGISRTHLHAIQRVDFVQIQDPKLAEPTTRPKLVISARVTPNVRTIQTLQKLISLPDSLPTTWLMDRGEPVGVLHPKAAYSEIIKQGSDFLKLNAPTRSDQAPTTADNTQFIQLESIQFPHELIQSHMRDFAENLQWKIANGHYEQLQDGVFVKPGMQLPNMVAVDVRSGPIVIESGVQIGPFSLLRGPLYLGEKCKVLEHSSLKDGVCAGHTTKIGGEVEASIIEPYTNKQHHGFLGHSYVGSWVNLGAGTCTSDLKNTYGHISMEYPTGRVSTGMQFLGCFIGDYSKTAINTSIFTGKWIGVCSAMYGFVTTNVPSFTNYAKLFGQIAQLPPSVMIATQQRMFNRRGVTQRQCDIDLIHALYDLTRKDREELIDTEESL